MSAGRKSKPSASQEDSTPAKKQCMDLLFHDDSSVSKFTWPEDGSESSSWQICDADAGDNSNPPSRDATNPPSRGNSNPPSLESTKTNNSLSSEALDKKKLIEDAFEQNSSQSTAPFVFPKTPANSENDLSSPSTFSTSGESNCSSPSTLTYKSTKQSNKRLCSPCRTPNNSENDISSTGICSASSKNNRSPPITVSSKNTDQSDSRSCSPCKTPQNSENDFSSASSCSTSAVSDCSSQSTVTESNFSSSTTFECDSSPSNTSIASSQLSDSTISQNSQDGLSEGIQSKKSVGSENRQVPTKQTRLTDSSDSDSCESDSSLDQEIKATPKGKRNNPPAIKVQDTKVPEKMHDDHDKEETNIFKNVKGDKTKEQNQSKGKDEDKLSDDEDDVSNYSDEDYYCNSSYSGSGSEYEVSDKSVQCNGISPLHIKTKVDRQAFVMKIMKAFKCNSLYDSFCFTLPRSKDAIDGYNMTVNGLLSLADQCRFGLIESTSMNFPSKESIDFAEGVVEDMRKRYKDLCREGENSNSDSHHSSEESTSSILEKEVDNDLPHNIIFMVSDGIKDIVSTWSGQFQVSTNPVTYIMSLRMFDYKPSFSNNIRPVFGQKPDLTDELCKDIVNEMEKFECSRQLRLDVDFRTFESLTFFKCSENEALLLINVKSPATFCQRLVNSSAIDRNDWQPRDNFLPFEHGCYQDYVLVLGGVVSELSSIAAQITVAFPSVKILNKDINEFLLYHISVNTSGKYRNLETNGRHRKSTNLSVDRRNNIIDVLETNHLLSKDKCEELRTNITITEINSRLGSECNGFDGTEFHPCFTDYLNYKCLDVSELEHQLSRRCNISEKMADAKLLDYNPDSNPDSQNMSVAEYLASNSNSNFYYSFCSSEIIPNDTWHCKVCGKCNQENEWHCPKCDKCSKAQPACQHCGYAGYTYIIKPGSVDESMAPKFDWKINLSTTDVPDWSVTLDHSTEKASFSMDDFMQDEFGLIDPMAFLLGSEARGGGKRQGRRLQKYEKKIEGNPKMLAAAGCILQ
ncbi:serine-rich adhesin for platelets-like [Mytilus edulis]|uniref:serine-rich adhesin for platelets-like n=1 Tax=Mytilus edulis TaxID=6550 RepID=UPI0039EFBBE2